MNVGRNQPANEKYSNRYSGIFQYSQMLFYYKWNTFYSKQSILNEIYFI